MGGGQIMISAPGVTDAVSTDRPDTAPGRENLQTRGECEEDVMPERLHSRMATPAVWDMQPGRPRVSGTGRLHVEARGVCGEWRVLRGSRAVRGAGVQPPMQRGTPALWCLKGGLTQPAESSIFDRKMLRNSPPPARHHTRRFSTYFTSNGCVIYFREPVRTVLTPPQASECDAFSPGHGGRGITPLCASQGKRNSL